MAVYNKNTNVDNERKYLNSLISQGGGNAEWAKKQMTVLDEFAKSQTPTTSKTTEPTTPTPTYNNKSVYDNLYSSTGGDIGTSLTNAINSGASVDTVKKIYQDRLSKATGTQYENDSIMQNALNYINANEQIIPVNAYAEELKKIQSRHDQNIELIRNEIDAAVKKGTMNLESQKGMINQGADEMARQAYILSRQNAKALPQQLASRGMTGGATETAQLGLMSNYENNLNNINTNRFNAINAIDTAKTDLMNQGGLSIAEQTLANNQAALNAYQNMLDKSTGYDQWATEFGYGVGRDNVMDNRYNQETASAAKQQEFNNVLTRLGMGLISPQDAVTLGVPQADVQAFIAQMNQPKTTKSSGAAGESGGSGGVAGDVIANANKLLAKGEREKAIAALASIMTYGEIKAYLEENGIRTDDIDWGLENTQSSGSSPLYDPLLMSERFGSMPSNLTLSLIDFYKQKGWSDQQIANLLNK